MANEVQRKEQFSARANQQRMSQISEPTEKESHWLIWTIMIIVVLAIIGAGIWYWFRVI